MPAIARGQSSNWMTPYLDIFTKVNGELANISELSFQIFEKITHPNQAIQIFPAVVGQKQSVNLNPIPTGERLGIGHYVATYSVALDALVGTHEIRWFFRLYPLSEEQFFAEEFEVKELYLGQDAYISVEYVRNLGLNSNPPNDAQIQAAIYLWQSFIDRATRQWFRPIQLELYVDGTDSDALHFGVPIISIEEVRLNDATETLATGRYKVYNAVRYPFDKQNPRIKLVDELEQNRDIFTAPIRNGRSIFRKGKQNQYVKGIFGCVDENGNTPELIKYALAKLVVEKLANPIVPGSTGDVTPPIMQGIVLEEWTDGHKIKFSQAGGETRPRAPGLTGITDDQEILDIIRLYKAPIGLATPANPSYR